MLAAFIQDRSGVAGIEYALIAALGSIAVIGALMLYQAGMGEMFQYISSHISSALSYGE